MNVVYLKKLTVVNSGKLVIQYSKSCRDLIVDLETINIVFFCLVYTYMLAIVKIEGSEWSWGFTRVVQHLIVWDDMDSSEGIIVISGSQFPSSAIFTILIMSKRTTVKWLNWGKTKQYTHFQNHSSLIMDFK